MNNERIDIELMESRIRLWREGDISDEDLALEMDYMVPELKRCYAKVDALTAALETIAIESSEDEIAKYAEQTIQTTSLY